MKTAEEIFVESAKRNMIHFEINDFKKTYQYLFKTIIEAMGKYASLTEHYDLNKLYEWIKEDSPKPAITAFTSGIARNIASEIEYQRSLTPPKK